MATTAKEEYERIRPRPRISYGQFHFVEPDPDFIPCTFACCAKHAVQSPSKGEGVPETPTASTLTSSAPSASSSVFDTPRTTPVSARVPSVSFRQISCSLNQPIPSSVSRVSSSIGDKDETGAAELEDSFDADDSVYDIRPVVYMMESNPQLVLNDSISALLKEGEEEIPAGYDSFDDDIVYDMTPNPQLDSATCIEKKEEFPDEYDSFDDDDDTYWNPQAVTTSLNPKTSNPQLTLQDPALSIPVGVEEDCPMEADSFDSFDNDDEIIGTAEIVNGEGEMECSDGGRKRNDMHGQFRSFLKDDSSSFKDEERLLGKELKERMDGTLRSVFGHETFREVQKKAITSVLLNSDVFLMAQAGEGKRLCYQLPAVLSEGVTVVISSVRSMIEDEKIKMQELGIGCEALTGNQLDAVAIYKRLKAEEPDIKLLYVSPDKISPSTPLLSVLSSLHRRGLLTRFVVVDAHCVSQWGHDYRPEYANLGVLRGEYPEVPIVAITATASPKIVLDTRERLGIKDCKMFISTFVRENLKYELKPKAAIALQQVLEELKQLYPGQSGIVYCRSRKDCGRVANALREAGFSAEEYHAGLEDGKRINVRFRWMNNRVNVICTTMALRIDKLDVRFVIHYSIPASIEDYYQETGRAGRDGEPATCVLLYSYKDVSALRSMIEKDDKSSVEVRNARLESFSRMVEYAENIVVCRRKVLVEHFGEIFDEEACRSGPSPCDVCRRKSKNDGRITHYDVSGEAKVILQCVEQMRDVTLSYLADLYRGRLSKKATEQARQLGHWEMPLVGRGGAMSESDSLRFLRQLVLSQYLFERRDGKSVYTDLTVRGKAVVEGREEAKVFLAIVSERDEAQLNFPAVSEATALGEKHRLKHPEVSARAVSAIRAVASALATRHGLAGSEEVLSDEGIEQIAALLPRTNSELLRVDSMTEEKIEKYGRTLMAALASFWMEVDDRDAAEITAQLESLKTREEQKQGKRKASESILIGAKKPKTFPVELREPKKGKENKITAFFQPVESIAAGSSP